MRERSNLRDVIQIARCTCLFLFKTTIMTPLTDTPARVQVSPMNKFRVDETKDEMWYFLIDADEDRNMMADSEDAEKEKLLEARSLEINDGFT